MRQISSKIKSVVLDLIYPRNCINCSNAIEESEFNYICNDCKYQIFKVREPFCNRCGTPYYGLVENNHACPNCIELNPLFNSGRTLYLLKECGEKIIHDLKYNAGLYLISDIKSLIRNHTWVESYILNTILVPVPLHSRKLRERSFNQSQIIAECFADSVKSAKIESLLTRIVDTPSQTNLSRKKRIKNVRKAFGIKNNTLIDPTKEYVIVDDVFTTGSTLNECSKTLRKSGAKKIKVLTFGHG